MEENFNIRPEVEDKQEERIEKTLRPQTLKEYIGQEKVKENMKIYIEAAKKRKEPLDHCLFYGPPGLGKTTIANIIANEMQSNIKITSGPAIEKPGDLAAILTTLSENDVLFIDEIHRIPRYIEEILYSAMEDFKLDIIIGGEGQSRSIKIDLPPFTLVGATTRAGDLSSPLRDRFGIVSKLEFYSNDELAEIVKRTARVLNVEIDEESAHEIAIRSRKTPRIANRLLKRVSDFALVESDGKINIDVVKKALSRLKINDNGLDSTDVEYLMSIVNKFNGGPVGIESIASSIGEEATTIEDVIEPFLLQEGYVKRTSRGRIVTEKTYREFKINTQRTLFDYE